MPNGRMTPERLAEIREFVESRGAVKAPGTANRCMIDLLAELDAVTRERDEAQRRLDMARTLVEGVADDCARRGEYNSQVLALAIREILHDDAIDAALAVVAPHLPSPAALGGDHA